MAETFALTGVVSTAAIALSGATGAQQITATGTVSQRGEPGTDGIGVPAGGDANQVLIKDSSTDNDTSWHTLVKGDVGLGGVDNTPDAIKPVSSPQQAAIDAKVADAISDGVTTIAPSQNAVFDALALRQPLDATLTAIAGVATAADKLIYANGSDTFTTTDLTSAARTLLDDATTSDMRTTLGLAIGSNVQAWDADLDTWATKTAPSGTVLGTSDVQTITGAKTFNVNTLLDKGSQVFNVKAYGALGDGTTNDATNIQSAITAAQSAGGGIVYFPQGTYKLGAGLTVTASNVTLCGSGFGSTKLVLNNSVNANIISVTGTGTIGVSIQDMQLDGNKANQTSGHGIQIDTPYSTTDTQHYISNVDIINPYQDGISVINDTRVVRMLSVRVRYAGNNGFNLAGSDHQLINAIADACNFSGFVIYATNCQYFGCKAFYCDGAVSGYSGFRVEGSRNFFTMCEAQDNNEHGWRLIGVSNISLDNCIGDSNGKDYSLAGSGISVENTTNSNIVGGQWFDRAANAFPQSYGIVLSGTTTGCTTIGEICSGNVSGAYLDSSSGANTHGVLSRRIIVTTSTLTGAAAANTDYVYLLGTGAVYTQPTAVGNTSSYTIKNTTSGSLSISSTGGQTFDGGTLTLAPAASVTIYSDNSNWQIT